MEDGLTPTDQDVMDLARYCQQFEESEDATRPSRELSERDRDYYDEKQWTATEIATLEGRGQPAITYNRIKRKVNSMMGLEKQTRKDPKAFPRNPNDEQAAAAATDTIRYVCEDSRWDDKRSQAAKELAIEGTCAVMVGVKQVKAGIDPDIRRIQWDRFYYDPHASEFDFADASYMGIVIWMDLDKAVAKYPAAKDILEQTWTLGKSSETYDDKPKHHLWSDYKRRRVRICEHYYLEATGWQMCIFTKGGFIVKPMASPYQGDDGKPENPIKAVSLYIDRDNNRYGEVRTMIGPQDEINKRRSKALHLISQRQVRVSPSLGIDAKAVRKELSRPDGVFVGEKDEVEILPTNDMAAANLQLLQEAKTEIDLQGPNAALGGKNEAEMSGRAILAQQQGGMTELATYLDCVRVLSMAVYRSSWCRIQQFWTEERWVRVTDNDKNVRFVGVNKPVTMIQAAAEQMGITKDNLAQMQQEQPEAVARLQAMAQDPRAEMIHRTDNAVGELDVDILVDEGIDSPTIAAEEFDSMMKMAGTGMVQFPPEVLIQASSLRNKDKLLEMLKQPPDPATEIMKKVAVEGAMADVDVKKSTVVKNLAGADAAKAKAEVEQFTAGAQMAQAA